MEIQKSNHTELKGRFVIQKEEKGLNNNPIPQTLNFKGVTTKEKSYKGKILFKGRKKKMVDNNVKYLLEEKDKRVNSFTLLYKTKRVISIHSIGRVVVHIHRKSQYNSPKLSRKEVLKCN